MALEGMQFGHYRLLRSIGSGGMGEVYLAEDTRIARQVAIKVVRKEADPYPANAQATQDALRLFQREMKAITTLDHPNILPLIDFGEQTMNNAVLTYMVMPYRPEGSLVNWLHQQSKQDVLPAQEVVQMVLQAAGALQHAHNRHLMHLDVKPPNFLIRTREDTPRHPDLLLADFGIAKFNSATATASQSVRGTPAYMAPEQWAGSPVAATDQYALAVMAYQLLTGTSPFLGNMQQVMYQHLQVIPKPPSSINSRIPPAVDNVILRALAKKPEDRFPSIQAFATVFEQACRGADTPKPKGDDIRATLVITETEALTGTTRILALPGGRQVTATVPAGVQNNQVLRLEGQGEPSKAGGLPGALILALTIMQTEKDASAPGPGPTPKPIPVPALGPVDTTDSFDAITGRTKRNAGLVYLVPLALSIFYVFAPLAYLVFFTIALIVQRRAKKPSRFVRFHTMQSVLWFGVITVVGIILAIILILQSNAGAYPDPTATIVLGILFLIVLLVVMIGAFLGKYTKLPFLWKRAEKFADRRRVAAVK